MAELSVTNSDGDSLKIEGELKVSRELAGEPDNLTIVVGGYLTTKSYIEDIDAISTSRFRIEGVEVQSETFDADDDHIVYVFGAEDFCMQNSEEGEHHE